MTRSDKAHGCNCSIMRTADRVYVTLRRLNQCLEALLCKSSDCLGLWTWEKGSLEDEVLVNLIL